MKQLCLDLEDNDPLFKVIKKYGITQTQMEDAILALAYTFAKQDEDEDEVARVLKKGFKLLLRRMTGVDPEKFRKIFKV